jgi:hypothetical protein
MKSLNSKVKEIGTQAEHRHRLRIRYSKADFFCEGQEKRPENTGKASRMKTVTKNKKQERFSGHFNMFL